jgi:hypothetical protein
MRTSNFEALATAAPLNREASVVRDGSGDTWTQTIPEQMDHWTAPPLPLSPRPDNIEDLTGKVFGRLTVIRFHGSREGKHARPVWLVRCLCGDYETRRHKTLQKAANPDDACLICTKAEQLRKRGAKTTSGAYRRKAAAAFAKITGEAA